MKPVAVLRYIHAWLVLLLALSFNAQAQSPPAGADYYDLPAALAGPPFSCTAAAAPKTYNCPSISLGKESVLVLTQDVTIKIAGSFSAGKELWTENNGYTLNVDVAGSAAIQKAFNVHMNLTAGGSISMAKDATLVGNVTAGGSLSIGMDATITGNVQAAGDIAIGSGSIIQGNVQAGGNLNVDSGSTIVGNCSYSSTNYTCQPPAATLHHIRLNHTGSGLTCTPSTVTVTACNGSDNNGVCSLNTGGVAGNVIAVAVNGTTAASVPFTIPAGSSSVSVALAVTSPQQVTIGVGGLSISPGNARTCWTGSSASCSHDYADSDLRFTIPNHVAGTPNTVFIQALKKGGNQTCVPGFTGSRNINFRCTHLNPLAANASIAPAVNGSSMSSTNAKCDVAGRTLALTFDNTGTTSTTMAYADVGQVSVTATDSGTGITGDSTFIAAPASFTLNANAATVAAGTDYTFAFTARNTAGAATPSFGKESPAQAVALSPVLCTPAAPGGVVGTYATTGITYSNGTGTAKLAWNESGTANVKADLPGGSGNPGYLGSGIGVNSVTSTGCPLTALPHHFDLHVTETRTFWYSQQPITNITVTAMAAGGGITSNYPKDRSANVALSAWTAGVPSTAIPGTVGSVSPATVATASFADGIATLQPNFKFTDALTAPLQVQLRATGLDTVNSGNSGTAATVLIRSGRLRLSNVFGSAQQPLQMPVQAEYWTGQGWLRNADDNTTAIAPAAAALSPNWPTVISATGGAVQLVGGRGAFTLGPPSAGRGTVDVALNLGSAVKDNSCLSSHPDSTPANLIWLRSRNGSCAATYDRDPSARATFGLSSPESRATVHVREVFN